MSFDALNKNIRETNKQGRQMGNKEVDSEEVVRRHPVQLWDGGGTISSVMS